MEYVQERVTTLHDLTDPTPTAPTDRATVVVPMTEREYAGLAPDRVLSELERVDPGEVVVPLRAPADRVGDASGTPVTVNGPTPSATAADRADQSDGPFGNHGRDLRPSRPPAGRASLTGTRVAGVQASP